MRPAQSGFRQIPSPLWASASPSVSLGHPRSPPGRGSEDNGRGRAEASTQLRGPNGRWWTEFQSLRFLFRQVGPRSPARAGPASVHRGAGYRGRAGGSVRPRPGWAAAQAWQAQRKEGRILHLPPGPARTVPTRVRVRACAASCRAASSPTRLRQLPRRRRRR